MEQIIRREVRAAEQTRWAWEDFLLWKGRETVFTELPEHLFLYCLENASTKKQRLEGLQIPEYQPVFTPVALLGFKHGALYRPERPNSPVA